MSLDLMNCVFYVIHNAALSILMIDWNKSCGKRIKIIFCSVCAEQQSGPLTHWAGAWTGIIALHFEIDFTEGLVLPALATLLKGMDSIGATSWVDLSLPASVSFGEWHCWRKHNTTPHLLVCFILHCLLHSNFCLVSFELTMAEVFWNLLLSNNDCSQVKFIYRL